MASRQLLLINRFDNGLSVGDPEAGVRMPHPFSEIDPDVSLNCYAIKVRSRREQAIAEALRGKHYEVLSPTYIEQRRYSDRIRRVQSALFPGYLFVRMKSENLLPLITTPGVSYVVGSAKRMLSLTNEEATIIEALCRLSETQRETCEPWTYLRVGQKVRIHTGPLTGLTGILLQMRGKHRIVVSVESLCSSVSVEVGQRDLHVVEGEAKA
jgi:transcription antitermination factor NusG